MATTMAQVPHPMAYNTGSYSDMHAAHAAAAAAAASAAYEEADGYETAAYILASIAGQLNNLLVGLQAQLDKDRREIREQRAWLQNDLMKQAEARRYEELRQQAEAAEAAAASAAHANLMNNQPMEEKVSENPAGAFLLNLVKSGPASSGEAPGPASGAWEPLPQPPPGVVQDAEKPQAFDILRKAIGGKQGNAAQDVPWGQSALDIVRNLIVGSWRGPKKESYEVENISATTWTCTKIDPKGIRDFTMTWREEWQGIVWESFYLTARDLQNSPGQVVWYGMDDAVGKGPRLVWTRAQQ